MSSPHSGKDDNDLARKLIAKPLFFKKAFPTILNSISFRQKPVLALIARWVPL